MADSLDSTLAKLRNIPVDTLVSALLSAPRGAQGSESPVAAASSGSPAPGVDLPALSDLIRGLPVEELLRVVDLRSLGESLHAQLSSVGRDTAVVKLGEHRAALERYSEVVRPIVDQLRARPAASSPETFVQESIEVPPEQDLPFVCSVPIVNPHDKAVPVGIEVSSSRVGGADCVEARSAEVRLQPHAETQLEVVINRLGPEPAAGIGMVDVYLDERHEVRVYIRGLGPEKRAPPARSVPDVPLNAGGTDVTAVLREAQLLLLKHPVAAQAAFQTFVREGRAFAKTSAGAQWRARLEGSELIDRGRVVWEIVTMKLLEEESPTTLPSKLLEAFAKTTRAESIEQMLTALFDPDPEEVG